MMMVIFGAGASYDSAQAFHPAPSVHEPWRPPLANNLFHDQDHSFGVFIRKYGKLSHILPYLRDTGGRSVEQVLEGLQEQAENYPEGKRELASVRFYLCDLLNEVTDKWTARTNGITNYAPLLRDILRFNKADERVCLVTFNYDLLLERALMSYDFKWKEPEQFLDSRPIFKLFKLHGSVNWSRLTNLPAGSRYTPQSLIDQADTITLSDNYVRATATNEHEMFNSTHPIVPAIAIPVQTKTIQYFECPPSHREYLAALLPQITKILIIGWQAKEAHFLTMLRSNLPRLRSVMVVGANKSDAEQTLRYFMGEIGRYVPSALAARGGFTDFIVFQEGPIFFGKAD